MCGGDGKVARAGAVMVPDRGERALDDVVRAHVHARVFTRWATAPLAIYFNINAHSHPLHAGRYTRHKLDNSQRVKGLLSLVRHKGRRVSASFLGPMNTSIRTVPSSTQMRASSSTHTRAAQSELCSDFDAGV